MNPPEGGFTILLREDKIREVEAFMAQKLQAKGLPAEWSQVGIVYQDQFGMILRDAVIFPGGAPGTYIRFIGNVESGPSAIILPRYQGDILLIRRFHHATRSWHLEMPIGLGVKGLSGEENARRELAEEIGVPTSTIIQQSLKTTQRKVRDVRHLKPFSKRALLCHGSLQRRRLLIHLLPALAQFQAST